ncbi:MAG: quinone-dependent dihydroorotate dehydrogenase, partial [Thermomicrobium sp.]|nr:quinone-dependent dihydroorotate dehydrogenase [Thermomicrobium sp.]
AHRLVVAGLGTLERVPGALASLRAWVGAPRDARLRVDCGPLSFPNPVGLAAGVDKNGVAIGSWFALGFGTVEVGTVTPLPQVGNPRPRLWRLPSDEALVNALGFPSVGAARVRERLVGRRWPGPVGINLGKNAATPLERAADDYCAVLAAVWDAADYLVVNVSSPNTPGLRTLQHATQLERLLVAVQRVNRELAALHRTTPRPVLVKVSLDIELAALGELVAVVEECGVTGLVLGNTSTDPSLRPRGAEHLPGGVSGKPLRARAVALLARAAELAGERLCLVSVGGIVSPEDAIERLRLGAHVVQLCTGLVYRGPCLPGSIVRALIAALDEDGIPDVRHLRGR